ncbi:MAG: hypothetical protein ACLR2E_04265 [Lachnospiraceae bacterium]
MGIFLLSCSIFSVTCAFQSAGEGVRAEEGIVYYLEEEEGKVSIYQGEEHNLYEKTSIPVKQLPAGIQEEIREGKSLSGEGELFSFLENYSS